MNVDELIDTRTGLALANAAWQEGAAEMFRAVEEADRTGVFAKPRSPYSAPLLRRIKNESEEKK